MGGQAGDPRAREALTVLCRALLDDVEALADRLTVMILEGEDVYAELGVPVQDDLRETCVENLRRALTVLAGDLPTEIDAAALTVATGRRRARQGVPLEVVLRAYRLCGRLLWDRMLAASRERFGGAYDEALLAAANDVWRMIDHSSGRLVDAYRGEEARLHGLDAGRRYSALEGLLDGRGRDPGFVRDAARVLGLPEHGELVCAVAPVEHHGEGPDVDPMGTLRETLLGTGHPSVWHARPAELVGLVPVSAAGSDAPELATIAAALRAAAPDRVGLSPPVAQLAQLDVAHRWAAVAARTLPAGAPGVAVLDDRLPEALLVGSPELTPRLRRAALGGLLDLATAERRTLLDTLEATLAADGSPSRAARRLYCHRNTVMYRLARIENLTGRRLSDHRDRLLLGLGLLCPPEPES